jgi:hypothetical protein
MEKWMVRNEQVKSRAETRTNSCHKDRRTSANTVWSEEVATSYVCPLMLIARTHD